jgi:hypothetical protein
MTYEHAPRSYGGVGCRTLEPVDAWHLIVEVDAASATIKAAAALAASSARRLQRFLEGCTLALKPGLSKELIDLAYLMVSPINAVVFAGHTCTRFA